MIGAPTTTADLFTQMAQAHYQKTASMVVQASDAYLMGKVAAHSPNLQLEFLVKQAEAYEPQLSKVASGYVRYLEKLSYTDPERAAYLAKQAGVGSFLGRMAGGVVRRGAAAGRAVGRAGRAVGGAVGRGGAAVGRGAGRATGWLRSAPARARSGLSSFKSEIGSGYRKAMGGTGFAGPQRAPGAYASPAGRVSGTARVAPPTGTATQYTAPIGPMPAKPTAVKSTRGLRGATPGTPAARTGGAMRGAAPEPTLQRPAATPSTPGFQGPQRPTSPAATPSTPGFQGPTRPAAATPGTPGFQGPMPKGTPATSTPGPYRTPEAPTVQKVREAHNVAGQAADVLPAGGQQQQQQQQGGGQSQGFRFPWLKAGLLAGSVTAPLVAMKGLEAAQSTLGSNVQAPYRAGGGMPQYWNQNYLR